VGLELYTRAGPAVVEELRARGKKVFLDLKLHDIPNTVAGAVHAASELGVDLLTVHGVGGGAMMEAARRAAGGGMRLLAVTVLTSHSPDDLRVVWGREVRSAQDEVSRLAELAFASGMDGVVASPLEVAGIRREFGADFLLVTPGIRPEGTDQGDQKRVATPRAAVEAGSDYLVVGRAVTRAADPRRALEEVLAEVRAVSGEDH
ncbi:MAG: orotidine-5'-phosphate decarboxylase, partial [Gemmatimonadota bacterium]|nr:orotidine-5'-phosphate decarboxylase [Gemmatimonadota bacterium]